MTMLRWRSGGRGECHGNRVMHRGGGKASARNPIGLGSYAWGKAKRMSKIECIGNALYECTNGLIHHMLRACVAMS